MTFAWYGHLKLMRPRRWLVAILASWGIAFFEYCFQVPANRIGQRSFSAAQLKIMQEVITLVVFAAFRVLYLKRAAALELPGRLRADSGGGVLCVRGGENKPRVSPATDEHQAAASITGAVGENPAETHS